MSVLCAFSFEIVMCINCVCNSMRNYVCMHISCVCVYMRVCEGGCVCVCVREGVCVCVCDGRTLMWIGCNTN